VKVVVDVEVEALSDDDVPGGAERRVQIALDLFG
jgi:hypothetical protein